MNNNILLPASDIAWSGSGEKRSLILTPATDETGSTRVTLRLSDGALEATATFMLTVYPVNVPPSNIALSNNTFIESIGIGKVIGTFITTDENRQHFHTYSLVSGEGDTHNGLFVIEGDKLVTNGEFNFEVTHGLSIRVRTTDQWGETFEKEFLLHPQADPGLELNIPTAFTPNNDRVNDTWEIDNITLHSQAAIRVFRSLAP